MKKDMILPSALAAMFPTGLAAALTDKEIILTAVAVGTVIGMPILKGVKPKAGELIVGALGASAGIAVGRMIARSWQKPAAVNGMGDFITSPLHWYSSPSYR